VNERDRHDNGGEHDFTRDMFLSLKTADKPRVRRLAERLRALAKITCLDRT
jgi:hypothetical protein